MACALGNSLLHLLCCCCLNVSLRVWLKVFTVSKLLQSTSKVLHGYSNVNFMKLNAIVVWAYICLLFWFICQGFNGECVFSHMVMVSFTPYKLYVDGYTLLVVVLVVLNDYVFWKHNTQLLIPRFLRIVIDIRQLGSIHSTVCIEC